MPKAVNNGVFRSPSMDPNFELTLRGTLYEYKCQPFPLSISVIHLLAGAVGKEPKQNPDRTQAKL